MTHDPLCTFAPCECYKDGSGIHSCGTNACQCKFIAKVRADTLRQACLMIENIFGSAPSIFPTDDEAIRYVQGNLRSLAYPMGSGRP